MSTGDERLTISTTAQWGPCLTSQSHLQTKHQLETRNLHHLQYVLLCEMGFVFASVQPGHCYQHYFLHHHPSIEGACSRKQIDAKYNMVTIWSNNTAIQMIHIPGVHGKWDNHCLFARIMNQNGTCAMLPAWKPRGNMLSQAWYCPWSFQWIIVSVTIIIDQITFLHPDGMSYGPLMWCVWSRIKVQFHAQVAWRHFPFGRSLALYEALPK